MNNPITEKEKESQKKQKLCDGFTKILSDALAMFIEKTGIALMKLEASYGEKGTVRIEIEFAQLFEKKKKNELN